MRGTIESLEHRKLLSAYGKYDAKGVFRVFGTDGDDQIRITLDPVFAAIDSSDPNAQPPLVGYSPTVMANGNPLAIRSMRSVTFPPTIRVYLGDGNDSLSITNPEVDFKGRATLMVDGGAGDDSIRTGRGDDTVLAGAGEDTVFADGGNDRIEGSTGSDDLRGGEGNDRIYGNNGHDRIRPGGGEDSVYGGVGDDRIYSADTGATAIYGERGDDTLYSGLSRDHFIGGAGRDVVDYSVRSQDLLVLLALSSTPQDADRLVPGLGENQPRYRNNRLWDDGRASLNEIISRATNLGGGRAQTSPDQLVKPYVVPDDQARLYGTGRLEGDSLVDVEEAIAGSGDDVMIGSEARDVLRAGAGRDTIFAGGGKDDCYGDDGDDLFFTVDTRDGMPTIVGDDGRFATTDLIDGGRGKDLARVDSRDVVAFQSNVESLENLRALYS